MADHPEPFIPTLFSERLTSDLATPLDVLGGLRGFDAGCDRPDERFAYVTRGTARVVLEHLGAGRNRVTWSPDRPYGRGVNVRTDVAEIAPILRRLGEADWSLVMAPEMKTYLVNGTAIHLTRFQVQDSDGYLLGFSARLPGWQPGR